jgi:thymidylate synthase (FAD)
MNVKLISVTQPRIDGINTAEELIVHNARASSPDNQLKTETGARLLRYCMKHGHWSVFEQASMGVEIITSRAISAQILRHRSFHFQEFSQRYAEVTDFEPVQLRKQADTNGQSSSEEIKNEKLKNEIREYICDAIDNYEYLIEKGVARECARMILPMCTQTRVYMTGTVRDWVHYLQLRTKQDTQKEHREIAEKISEIFAKEFPQIAECLSMEDTK